jgi:hypothetical protein
MSLGMLRRLERLEVLLAPVKRLRVYWLDSETGERTWICGGEDGDDLAADGRG